MKRAVIWGLANHHHTHRYIHQGFYETFKAIGWDTDWVDDKPDNNACIKPGDLVISVDVASSHLQNKSKANYVLHNVERPELRNHENVTVLQVFTFDAFGESLFGSRCLWDQKSRTIYQPWGIPSQPDSWLEPRKTLGTKEFWVGSIWNNDQNQGNSQVISEYKAALESHGIRLKHTGGVGYPIPKFLGGAGLFRKTELSELEARDLVAKSPIGAAVVGNWQRDHGYVPCRLFKNLAAGQVPSSNADFSDLFGDLAIATGDFSHLIETRLSLPHTEVRKRVREGQAMMANYTYQKSIERILSII